jgi:UDP-N-acetylglucosamine acyltransferase
MPKIHPTATISGECQIADDADIGPYCGLTGRVTLGAGVRLISNVQINGPVKIGPGTVVYPYACLGFAPQDVKFKPGDPTAGAVIGAECQLREYVTVHAATKADTPTRVGDRVFIMVNSHVGHDAHVDDDAVLVNNTALAGHSYIGKRALLSGGAMIHQFTRVGRLGLISVQSGTTMDIPPFCVVAERNRLSAINLIGMRRSGMNRTDIDAVKRAYREVLRPSLQRPAMLEALAEIGAASPAVMEIHQFVKEAKRPICPGNGRPPRALLAWLQAARRGTVPVEAELGDSDEE